MNRAAAGPPDHHVDHWVQVRGARSPLPDTGRIAVKVINHYGDEVLQVYEIKPTG